MARPSKRTPKKLERVRAERAAGKGLREAAKAAGVSHETVREWERRDQARAPNRNGKNMIATPAPVASNGSAQVAPAAAEADAIVGRPVPDALAEINARRATVLALLDRLTPAVERDEYSPAQYITLSRYADELAVRAAELAPPSPTNAKDDDANTVEAERILLARIEAMVTEAEANADASGWRAAP